MLGWELPPHNSGGLGVACLNLSKSLAKMGADIDFVVPYEAEHHLDYMNVLSACDIDPLVRYGGAYESKEIETKKFHQAKTQQYLSIRDIQKSYCEFAGRRLKVVFHSLRTCTQPSLIVVAQTAATHSFAKSNTKVWFGQTKLSP